MTVDLAAFLLASLLLAMFPGPGTAVLMRQSIRGGRKAAFATVAGLEAGVLFWAVAAALGLSVLLFASEIAYQTLRVIGVVVLLWFGIKALRSARTVGELEVDNTGVSVRAGFTSGLLVNLANPKLAVFAISFLPQFVPAGSGRGALVALAVLWVVMDTVWYLAITLLLARIAGWLRRANVRKRLEQVTGVVLIGLGVRLAAQVSR
ncbi:threonine/homoserine/homoserine lactone efflux protein [Herbihabitans rhizosphaerae]|uniref:Threonine/homoserine/homoserine lactone efflux protein n=1 Tax=Herbihabitans rhizosphaerae TaxID=1872711 RepID=A0A4Q7KZH5_9PSEU|nr:LysE family translocator [Herbihabitans rhizosphaerae]RZS41112.1 threonine/homoserine/homoserine lactone efflux protein [Herbihabitans rhizosphaerae]